MATYRVTANDHRLIGEYAQFAVQGRTVYLYFEQDGTGITPDGANTTTGEITEEIAAVIRQNDPAGIFFLVREIVPTAPADDPVIPETLVIPETPVTEENPPATDDAVVSEESTAALAATAKSRRTATK